MMAFGKLPMPVLGARDDGLQLPVLGARGDGLPT